MYNFSKNSIGTIFITYKENPMLTLMQMQIWVAKNLARPKLVINNILNFEGKSRWKVFCLNPLIYQKIHSNI